jgi:hypothetical protein
MTREEAKALRHGDPINYRGFACTVLEVFPEGETPRIRITDGRPYGLPSDGVRPWKYLPYYNLTLPHETPLTWEQTP